MANNRNRRGSYIDSLPDRVFDGYVFRYGRQLKDGARYVLSRAVQFNRLNRP